MYDRDNDVERIFYSDVSEKKRAGRGAFHMKGKGVKHGMSGIVFPSDYLKPKEKRLLNGEIKMSNVYDDIGNVPSIETIKEYDFEKAKKILSVIKDKHSNSALMKHWGIKSAGSLYTIFYNYEVVERGSRKYSSRKKVVNADNTDKIKTNKIIENEPEPIAQEGILVSLNRIIEEMKTELVNLSTMVVEEKEKNVQASQQKTQGFKIMVNGEYEQEEISSRVLNILQTLVSNEKYNVMLEINEIE